MEQGIHDLIVDELFDKHSIAALIYTINVGRELEFTYKDTECFLAKSNSKRVVSLWVGKEEQAFESIELLISNATLGGEVFIKVWSEVKLICLF